MGVLDDLKAEREKEQIKIQQEASEAERTEEIYRAYLRPEFKALFRYLQEMADHLNHIETEIKVEYRLPGNIGTGKLRQQNYEVTVDSSDQMQAIQFRCEAVSKHPFIIPAESDQAAAIIMEKLRQFGLPHAKRDPKRSGYICAAIVEVTPKIPISFEFVVDKEKLGAWLIVKNYIDFEVVREFTDADNFGEQWHEEIGELILRKNNKLISPKLSDKDREKIKQQLDSDKKKAVQTENSIIDNSQEQPEKSLWKKLFGK